MANKTKSIKGTQTEKNLAISYMNEAQAYARYTFYAQQADKEKYFPIGEIFRDTASNELRHGKIFLKMLEGGTVDIALTPDAGVIGDTATNLEISIKEEKEEGVKAYIAFAKVADGRATKIIIPSEIQNLAGMVASIKEIATDLPPESASSTK